MWRYSTSTQGYDRSVSDKLKYNDMEFGNGFAGAFFTALIVVFVVIGGTTWIISKAVYNRSEIESPTEIVPEIKLSIKDNRVDTTYVYRKQTKNN